MLRPRRLLRPSMMMRPTTVMQRETTWSSWSKLHQTLLELVVLPLCASEAQDLLLLKHRIAILLASHPRQTSSVLFLVRAAFAGLSVQQPNNLSQEAPLPFWLSFSFSLFPPPSFFASIVSSRVPTWPQWGSVLSNARRPTTTIVERWVGGHGLGLEHVHFYTHTHILLLFFLICREQNSRGSKRPKARRGILIRMLGGPLLYRPRTSSAVVVSNKQQEQSLAGMSEAGGRGQGRRTHRFCPGLYCSPLPPTLELALSPPPHPIFRPFNIPA